VVGGTLPSGLSLGGDCRITGTPASAGTASFTVRVSDAGGRAVNASGSVSVLPPVAITTSTLPGAVANRAFSTTLLATGGRAPYGWSVVGGTLPSGLALDLAQGTIAGRPTALGASAFTVRVQDALGATSDRSLRLVVNQVPLTVTCGSAPAQVGMPFTAACTPQGGLAPYACDVVAGAPPQGVTVNGDCTIAGTPAVAGPVSFTTRVRDSLGSVITVPLSVQVQSHLAIETTALPPAMSDRLFNTTLAASGGMPPYTWSVVAGVLPSGLALNPADGQLIGAPTVDGVMQFTIRVTDALGATFDQRYELVVNYGR
jgi:large repetitive protein